ncbi:hypothetical protein E2C01_013444 [Portunus trituberculatus]|uniref:Uncharacterized protein n=1 Tax=Portunus trituberculatus TaxID=210409 RepID=A0A5B7DH42_PORTR|nr:hypothetical protein [Portunus trituberculatus]
MLQRRMVAHLHLDLPPGHPPSLSPFLLSHAWKSDLIISYSITFHHPWTMQGIPSLKPAWLTREPVTGRGKTRHQCGLLPGMAMSSEVLCVFLCTEAEMRDMPTSLSALREASLQTHSCQQGSHK